MVVPHAKPWTFQTSIIMAKDHNVQKLRRNLWLISVSDYLPINFKLKSRENVRAMILLYFFNSFVNEPSYIFALDQLSPMKVVHFRIIRWFGKS